MPSAASVATLDALFSSLVVTPLVVAFWRATWTLQDILQVPPWHGVGLGLLLTVLSTLAQECLVAASMPYVLSALYVAAAAWVDILLWRGAFAVLDTWLADAWDTAASMAAATLLLASCKTTVSLISVPLMLEPDSPRQIFTYPTRYRTTSQKHGVLYVLDCLFSILIIGNLVVVVWRGFWTLLDIYLFPGRDDWSAFASLGIGYAIVVVAFGLQTPLKIVCSKVSGLPRLAVLDVYLFFAFCGTVNVWRGVWNLLNIYFLPESPELSLWLSHAGALALLMLLNCSNSVLVRGVFVDGEEEGGKCAVFPCYYLRLFFQERRLEKLARAHKAACNNANHAAALASLMDNPESTL